MTRIVDLTELTQPASTDLLEIVDVATGTSKKVELGSLRVGNVNGSAPSDATTYTVPGVEFVSASTRAMVADTIKYMPIIVDSPIVFDAFLLSVSAFSGSLGRVGLFTANSDWQPTSVFSDGGTFVTTSTGSKIVTVSNTTVPAGRYLLAVVCDLTPTLRFWRGQLRYGAIAQFTATPWAQAYTKASVGVGAFTVVAWDTQSVSNAVAEYYVALRVLSVEQ